MNLQQIKDTATVLQILAEKVDEVNTKTGYEILTLEIKRSGAEDSLHLIYIDASNNRNEEHRINLVKIHKDTEMLDLFDKTLRYWLKQAIKNKEKTGK